MTIKEIRALAKLRVRVSARSFDRDIKHHIDVAIADLKRIGVHESYIGNGNVTDPIIIEAILLNVAANFGNPDNSAQLSESYQAMLIKIKGGGYHRSKDNLDGQKEPAGKN
ncbi:MAG: hypothetical protein FWG91_13780 [Lachnospiraceae bacterium]|nr:hypothetical protein [Lachnospiraceae bacterium]